MNEGESSLIRVARAAKIPLRAKPFQSGTRKMEDLFLHKGAKRVDF